MLDPALADRQWRNNTDPIASMVGRENARQSRTFETSTVGIDDLYESAVGYMEEIDLNVILSPIFRPQEGQERFVDEFILKELALSDEYLITHSDLKSLMVKLLKKAL
ncbi:MAG: hypothetical protein EA369_02165 [Bradymonadales bacterium]|nr:MAG: hypothetical protein EA369_02165 [Bradymonadales bacterium]